MGRLPAVITVVLMSTTLFAGCKEKVDCTKMQSRLTKCMPDNYKALNKNGRNLSDPKFKKDANEVAAKYAKLIDKHYADVCKAIDGKDKRAKKINKCLEQNSCTDVHACLKHVLK